MSEPKKKKVGIVLDDASTRRRYPTSGFASNICLPKANEIWLPSKVLALNWQWGGGILAGRIYETAGEENTGKTLLGLDLGKSAQALGGIVLYSDAEATFDGYWAMQNGLDLSKVVLLPNENIIEIISDWSADMATTWRHKLGKNVPIILIHDSVAAWETNANMEQADSDMKTDMGRRAKQIGQLLRKRTKVWAEKKIHVYCINQLRDKVGATKWEDQNTTPGGKAMAFVASLRTRLFASKKIVNESKEPIGKIVRIVQNKTKVGPPKKSIYGRIYTQPTDGVLGYDPYFGFDELLLDLGILERKRGLYYRKGKVVAKGDDKLMELIRNDDDFRRLMIKKSGVNTISQTRTKIYG